MGTLVEDVFMKSCLINILNVTTILFCFILVTTASYFVIPFTISLRFPIVYTQNPRAKDGRHFVVITTLEIQCEICVAWYGISLAANGFTLT
mgnify:CR=1 FL=1